MKVLITGSGGFVGKNLVEGLHNKFDIIAPRSKELDLTDYKSVEKYLEKNRITHVVHAAVHSALATRRDEGFQMDLRMLINLTRNIDKLESLIVFGSGAEFDKTRDIKKVKEEEWGEYIPRDLYGLSKILTTEIVRREPKMLNLRLFGIYGPYEDYRYKFISNAIVKNLLGLPIKIKQDVVFDYLCVTDLIQVVEYFLTHKPKFGDYNVCPTDSIKLSEIARIINEISEKQSTIEVLNHNLNLQYTGSNNRLRQEIPDWKITDYREGIEKLYTYYQSILTSIDSETIIKDEFLARSKAK